MTSIETSIVVCGRRSDIRVTNISSEGLGAETSGFMPIGTKAAIELPSLGMVGVEIRWALGGRFGCRFTENTEPS